MHPQRELDQARRPGARVVRPGVSGAGQPRPAAGHLGARLQGRRRLRRPEGRLLVRAQRRARQGQRAAGRRRRPSFCQGFYLFLYSSDFRLFFFPAD